MFGEFKNVYDVLKKDDRLVASDGTLMKIGYTNYHQN